MTLTDRIEAIRKRADGATPGPWASTYSEMGGYDCMWDSWSVCSPKFGGKHTVASYDWRGISREDGADATFIAAARTDVPALCAALRVAVEALGEWPCFWCNGQGVRGGYHKETPDGEEWVPRGRCTYCDGTGLDREEKSVKERALAAIEQALS